MNGSTSSNCTLARLGLAVVGALAVAACSSDGNDSAADATTVTTTAETSAAPTVPVVPASTTVAATAPPPPAVPAEAAVEQAEAYLAAFSAGDVDAVLAQQTDDFVMRASFPGDPLSEQALTDWMGVVYQAAMGTEYTELDCNAAHEDETATRVACNSVMVTTIHQATNSDGVPTGAAITVTADGVAAFDSQWRENLGVFGYYEWRDLHALAPDGDPTTIDGIAELGRLEAQLVGDYTTMAIGVVEQAVAAFNSGDLAGFLAPFDADTTILGVDGADAQETFGGYIAAGQQYELAACEPAGILRFALAVDCTVTMLPALGADGVESKADATFFVGIDGIITRTAGTFDEFQESS